MYVIVLNEKMGRVAGCYVYEEVGTVGPDIKRAWRFKTETEAKQWAVEGESVVSVASP